MNKKVEIVNKSSRQLSRLVRVVLFLLSFGFAYFLLQGGALLLAQLPRVTVQQQLNDYLDQEGLQRLNKQKADFQYQLELKTLDDRALTAAQAAKEKRYQQEKERYQAMLQSRAATEDKQENAKVAAIRTNLDKVRDQLTQLSDQVSENRQAMVGLQNDIERSRLSIRQVREQARVLYTNATRHQALKSFLVRLAFALPILVLATVLVMRKRHSPYWPFVYGFGYFAVYVFFVELVPYFPSYGGYVRAGVGIVLCVLIGVGLIRKLNAYLAQKQAEENEDEAHRRLQIQRDEQQLELAIDKILGKHICPSCDRKLIDEKNRYCTYCGLCLLQPCPQCDTLQLSFNAHCQQCGVGLNVAHKKAPPEGEAPSR